MNLTINEEYSNIYDTVGNYFIVDWIINPNDESIKCMKKQMMDYINSETIKRYFDF